MIAKEAKEIVLGMELSSDVLKEVEGILSVYAESDEVPEEVINNILLIVDKEVEEALPKIISLIFTKWIADGN